MANQTQKYAQQQLDLAEGFVSSYGMSLNLSKNTAKNAKRVIDRGVNNLKDSTINGRRAYQKASGNRIKNVDYLYPLKDTSGDVIRGSDGKIMKVLLPYGVIAQIDPTHAYKLRKKLISQAEGAATTARQMEEVLAGKYE